MPPALMAATPVGAVTTNRLKFCSLIWCRNVVLPVPALPVRKTCLLVLRTYSNARSKWGLETKLIDAASFYVRKSRLGKFAVVFLFPRIRLKYRQWCRAVNE